VNGGPAGATNPMRDLTGKTALITGSARGIGKAIALRYARLGANIVVNYASSAKEADATVAEIEHLGAQAIAVQADMSVVPDIERLFAEAADRFGQIDIAVANAGVELIGIDFLDITEEQFDRLFAINTRGTFFTLQAAARHVVDGGRIIYVGSSTTTVPVPGEGLYGSSKTAPRYAVQVLAQELADRGVTVNTILPTAIEGAGVFTEPDPDPDHPHHPVRQFVARPGRIGRRMGTVDDVADAAEYLASPLAAWISGQSLLISGGALQ
jgi:3-oxoacyl-[acyl-carrier protein] reductase